MALTYKIKDFTDEKLNEKNTLSDDCTLKNRMINATEQHTHKTPWLLITL